jgi:hypothetical protein
MGLFGNFPKRRADLPAAYQKIYLEHYKKNRAGATPASFFSSRLERWLHKKTAADCAGHPPQSTLEIGAGTLNHLPYENSAPYDIVEPMKELYEGAADLKRIRNIYHDIAEIAPAQQYERIVSIANFEHVLNLPEMVARCCLLLPEQGHLRVAIPNEGTFLWRLGYTLSTGIEFRLKYGLPYSVLMKYEHVNTAAEIENILNYFFKKVECSCLGISKKLAFYRFLDCRLPDKNKAREYLRTL